MGCKKCSQSIKLNKDSFIEKANKIHNNKYDYSLVQFINSNVKIIIICKAHGNFIQRPSNHLEGTGCPSCNTRGKKLTTNEFIEKSKLKHGDKYDYSQVEFIDTYTKITIICKIHGEFEQMPTSHYLIGCGCYECSIIESGDKQRRSTDEFIEKANEVHNYKYDYSLVEYKGCFDIVKIICKSHGKFEQKPSKHIFGQGCTICNRNGRNDKFRQTKEEFIEKAIKIHGNLYDYSKVSYLTNNKDKVIIICQKHGEFNQTSSSHINKFGGCPLCFNKTEGILYNKLKTYYPDLLQQFRPNWCMNLDKTRHLPFDFCIEDKKIIIELDGYQHFRQVMKWKSPEVQQKLDIYKMDCANKNGYSVIRLLQDDVFNNNFMWLDELIMTIQNIDITKVVINICICLNDQYKIYKNNSNNIFIIC
jgi:very-short-patch-repair endonuclease